MYLDVQHFLRHIASKRAKFTLISEQTPGVNIFTCLTPCVPELAAVRHKVLALGRGGQPKASAHVSHRYRNGDLAQERLDPLSKVVAEETSDDDSHHGNPDFKQPDGRVNGDNEEV